jgi:uncharacterized membrane protein YbhN (UPF0104 family)
MIHRLNLFIPRQAGRVRRGSDAIVAVVAAGLLLVVAAGASSPPAQAEEALLDALWGAPGFLDVVWQLTIASLAIWIVVVLVAAAAGRRFGALADVAVGGVVAAGLWVVVDAAVGPLAEGARVPLGFAAACGVLASVRPHLGHPFRRPGRYLTVAVAVVLVLVEQTTPSGSILAVLLGVVAGSITHLVLGAPLSHPDGGAIVRSLQQLGVGVETVSPTPDQRAGMVTLDAVEPTGRGPHHVVVHVFGRDSRDTQLLTKVARSLWYRERHTVLPRRIQQAEHEAFVTMLAGTRGAEVPTVRAVGRTPSGDALVAFDGAGGPLRQIGPADVAQMWTQVCRVHDAGVCLHDVASTRFARTVDGHVVVGDLSTGGLAVDDDVLGDRAQLIAATTAWIGAEPALSAARSGLGDRSLAEVVPYLQPAVLGPELRRELRSMASPVDLDDVRDAAAELVEIDAPKVAQLRRVTAGALVQVGLITFAAYAVISLLGGVDVDELIDTLAGASLPWVVTALVVGQTPFITETLSTQGASVRRLALGPLVALQVAIAFVKLAIPSSAARMGMVLRYFQKQGVPAPTALAISAIETFTGFLVQIALLGLVLGIGSVELTLPDSAGMSTDELSALLAALLAVALICAVVVAVVPKLRHRLTDRFRPWLGDSRAALDTLRSPLRLLQLIGGNLATQLLYALALAACVVAFGVEIDLGAALAVYLIAALFGGFMPVPGGIGVMEAALTVGLVAVGIGESAALAAAITFRIVTFYLPPLWGWVAFRRLERNGYL